MAIKRAATAPAKPAAGVKKAAKPKPSQGQMRTARAAAAAAAPKSPEPPTKGIKVRATQMGYHGLRRRREGDVFFINDMSEFSERWMERVGTGTRLKETGAQAALTQAHDDILGGKVKPEGARLEDADDDDVK